MRTFSALVRLGGGLLAVAAVGSALLSGVPARASIVTNYYNVVIQSFGAPDPDGAFYPLGTPAQVSVSFDNALTYIGGPDTVNHTPVSIPSGLRVSVGSDVFTADNYYIDYYNAGPGRAGATIGFLTTDFSTLQPVLHNGLPFGGGNPGFMQFYFNDSASSHVPTPMAPGLSFPLPPWVAEGLVRETFSADAHSYYFPNGVWSTVPSPAGAGVLGLSVLAAGARRRRLTPYAPA